MKWGHPLKGESSEKTLLPAKKSLFCLAPASASARLVFTLFRTRYFFIIGSRSDYTDPHQPACACRTQTGHPSGSRLSLCFKNCLRHSPWSIRTPENHRFHAVSNWMYYKSYGY